jgi:hypothetical protein
LKTASRISEKKKEMIDAYFLSKRNFDAIVRASTPNSISSLPLQPLSASNPIVMRKNGGISILAAEGYWI